MPLISKEVKPWLQLAVSAIAQLGERQTEDLKVAGSIPARGKPFFALAGEITLPCALVH